VQGFVGFIRANTASSS